MLPAFLLSLREGIEAALIISIALGALRKIGRSDLNKPVWVGVISASLFSLAVAAIMQAVGAGLEGSAEETFEGAAMLLAAAVLTWMVFWMRRQARSLKADLENGVQQAALAGGAGALFGLAFLAVGREGFELALFLAAAAFSSGAIVTLAGTILGLAVATLFGWLLLTATLRLDLRRFFQVTGVLLILFAAGLAAHGVHEFNEAGLIPPIIEHIYDINHILDENSGLGIMLKALFGYNGNPSLSETLTYGGYYLVLGVLWLVSVRFNRIPDMYNERTPVQRG